jgi:FixJ family two-component response regulator
VRENPVVSVIDDEEDVRSATAALLRSAGMEAHVYASAEEFLASTDFGACGCVVTDLHMPGMNGLDLVRRLRAEGCQVPVIVITAYGADQVRRSAESLGANGFFEKPVDADALLSCIEGCIN